MSRWSKCQILLYYQSAVGQDNNSSAASWSTRAALSLAHSISTKIQLYVAAKELNLLQLFLFALLCLVRRLSLTCTSFYLSFFICILCIFVSAFCICLVCSAFVANKRSHYAEKNKYLFLFNTQHAFIFWWHIQRHFWPQAEKEIIYNIAVKYEYILLYSWHFTGILFVKWCHSCPRPTQPSIRPGSVNEYQLELGRQRQVWFIQLADECVVFR